MEKENSLGLLQKIKVFKIICCLPVLFGINVQAQEFRVNGNISYPVIGSLSESNRGKFPVLSIIDYDSPSSPTVKEVYTNAVGGKLGAEVRLDQRISDAFLDVGLQFDLIRFKRVNKIIFSDSTDLLCYYKGTEVYYKEDQFSKVGKTSVLYLEFPIHVGYKFLKKKLVFKLGVVQSFMLYSNQTKVKSSGKIIEDKSGDGINNLILGIDIEASYVIYKQFEGFMSYSRSFNEIYKDDYQLAGQAKYNLFSIGVKYQLFNYSRRKY
jgi:hypothetical protein